MDGSNTSPLAALEAADRAALEGTRLIRIRVPDVRSAAFREEARRQSLAVAGSPSEEADQAFIDAASDRSSW